MDSEVYKPDKLNGGMVAILVAVIALIWFIVGLGLGVWFL